MTNGSVPPRYLAWLGGAVGVVVYVPLAGAAVLSTAFRFDQAPVLSTSWVFMLGLFVLPELWPRVVSGSHGVWSSLWRSRGPAVPATSDTWLDLAGGRYGFTRATRTCRWEVPSEIVRRGTAYSGEPPLELGGTVEFALVTHSRVAPARRLLVVAVGAHWLVLTTMSLSGPLDVVFALLLIPLVVGLVATDIYMLTSASLLRIRVVDGTAVFDSPSREPRRIVVPLWGPRRQLAMAVWARVLDGPLDEPGVEGLTEIAPQEQEPTS